MLYRDRQDAGIQLAEHLTKYASENPIIIALPRGGVVLGFEVAKKLNAPLDVVATRKIGAPFHPEFGVGAIAPNGVRVLNFEALKLLKIPESLIEQIIERETIEMNRRANLYRKDLSPLDLRDKTVIVVDDGLATGVSTQAAIQSIKMMNPKKIILAVPVSPPETAKKFRTEVDEFLCLNVMPDFYAVGAYYDNFAQVTDDEVINLLQAARDNVNPA